MSKDDWAPAGIEPARLHMCCSALTTELRRLTKAWGKGGGGKEGGGRGRGRGVTTLASPHTRRFRFKIHAICAFLLGV